MVWRSRVCGRVSRNSEHEETVLKPGATCPDAHAPGQRYAIKAKVHYAILVADRSEAGRRPASGQITLSRGSVLK